LQPNSRNDPVGLDGSQQRAHQLAEHRETRHGENKIRKTTGLYCIEITDPKPIGGGCPGKGPGQIVDPGATVEESFKPDQPDFHKARDADLKQQRLTYAHEPTEKNKINCEKLYPPGLHSL
jgi:hypothetical protein